MKRGEGRVNEDEKETRISYVGVSGMLQIFCAHLVR
jgi:hypothetical protein